MPIAESTQLGPYKVLSPLGAGGMGEVYLAEDTRLHRKVALKILPADLAANRNRMRRFNQEAMAAAALNHPNIAHIYEIGEADGVNFIAMEYIDGATLREKIHCEQTELRKLLRYLQQVAEGLAKAHAAGIVHRDLKPDNVMITRDGYAKILDFGLAKLTEPSTPHAIQTPPDEAPTAVLRQPLSTPGLVMGTVGYMSPEQAQGKTKEIDHRSDIFSFGCLLYEAATGQYDTLAEAHTSLAHALFTYDWNFPEAKKEFQRAIELNPGYATAHQWYGSQYLAGAGRFEEAIAEGKQSQQLDPLSLVINADIGATYIYARQYDKAIEQLRKTLEMDQSFYYALCRLGTAYEMKGSFQEAIAEYQKARQLNDDPQVLALLARVYAISGNRERALRTLDQLKEISKQRYVSAYNFALVYAALGEKDQAFQWLEQGYQNRDWQMARVRVDPLLDNLHSDPNTEYLSDGITESIISSLAQLPNLKVMARTTVFRYKGQATDPQRVGKELGVGAILTGKVLQRGDMLVIRTDLVKASDGSEVWGEQYNRKLADVFAVQEEIAKE